MPGVLVSIALLFAAACGHSPSAPSHPVNARLVLAPGQVAGVEGTSIHVRFDRVDGDSRCPADAMCVLGGDAVVRIAVVEGGKATGYDLHTGNLRPVRHGELTIALEQLQPYPFGAHPIAPHEYRATLRVTD